MTTTEERKKILNMIAEGKITAEEGASLLKALQSSNNRKAEGTSGTNFADATTLRIRVTNMATGRTRANVSIPMSLVDVGMRMGAKFAPELEGIDINELLDSIRSGARGKVIEVEDSDDGERVEIYVE